MDTIGKQASKAPMEDNIRAQATDRFQTGGWPEFAQSRIILGGHAANVKQFRKMFMESGAISLVRRFKVRGNFFVAHLKR